MRKRKVHILYEYGINLRPHASASLRLIRPFSYPQLRERVDVTFGLKLNNESYDLVLVDRLWKPDIRPEMVKELVEDVHRQGAKLIYWLDDNFFFLNQEGPNAFTHRESFEAFLEVCDGLVVSTPELNQYFSDRTELAYLPSALDERLIVRKEVKKNDSDKIIIGYMGTATHDEDLRLIVPALTEIHRQNPGRISFQFVGALNQEKLENWKALKALPIKILEPLPYESEYQLFMLWFTGTIRWDLALAPLVNQEFNRYKSDVKFLDYTAAGVPGIFSNVPAYGATVRSGESGVLVNNDRDEWNNAIQGLIDAPQHRAVLLENALETLYQKRILARCWPNWVEVIEKAMAW